VSWVLFALSGGPPFPQVNGDEHNESAGAFTQVLALSARPLRARGQAAWNAAERLVKGPPLKPRAESAASHRRSQPDNSRIITRLSYFELATFSRAVSHFSSGSSPFAQATSAAGTFAPAT